MKSACTKEVPHCIALCGYVTIFFVVNIAGSPFHVHITDQVNPSKVRCYGPGIEPKGVRKGQPGIFTVDATEAGVAPLEVVTNDARGQSGQIQNG